MPVVIPPPRQHLLQRLLRLILTVALISGSVVFICYRFGDSPAEKAERLFSKHRLTELRDFTQKRLAAGEVNPLLMSYYVTAEFSVNPQANLSALLGNLRAVDDRVIFRRETLQRLLQLKENQRRAGEILTATLDTENPPGAEMLALIKNLLQSDADLSGAETNFARLQQNFPDRRRRVSAKSLQFRSAPNTESQVLRKLDDGEELFLRSSGAMTAASGKQGRWALVLDHEMVSGWVFDAYLSRE